MLFKSKKEQSKKEFIQYKDGKIVSVEVEKPRKPQGIVESEEIPLYQEIEEKKPKEKSSEKLKKWMTVKKLKVIIALIVLVLFAFTVADIYKAFFTGEPDSPPQSQVEQPSKNNPTSPVSSDKKPTATNPKETTKTDEPSTKDEPSKKNDEEKKPTTSTPSLQIPLDTANFVNQVLVSQSSTEIQYITNYAERKANKIGLENQLERTLKEKQTAYFALTTEMGKFNEPTLKALYEATEERAIASISFTKTAQQFLVEGRGKEALRVYSNEYISTDEGLREKQVNALIEVLKEHNISYKMNEVTNNVEFVLP